MHVRVLGEVAAGPDAQSLHRAPGRVPAALLAELALAQGRPVSAALLEDALWPPPAEVTRNALQAAVSRLRRHYGSTAVVGEAAGYRLAPPVTVDLVLAEQDLAGAREALAAGSRETALALAQRGLDLFVGRPLAGVELPAAEAVRARAQEARTGLVVVAARSQTSADAALVVLRSASASSPLDERLAAETIETLTSAGRATEAVQEYERFRRRLARELGVDPAGPVREAFSRALAAADAPPPSRDRRSLPAPTSPLVGRADDLARVTATAADPEVRLLTLLGPGGIGKTRLALEAAHRLTERTSVWWVPLAPLADPALVLPTIAHVLGCSETPGEVLSRSIARQLGDVAHLVVLDNAEHLLDPVAAAVAELLATAPGVTVLVTSREPLQVDGEHRISLLPMNDDDAVALLLARTRAVGAPVEPGTTATAICRRLDGLPLAVELVAPRLATLDAEALLASLDGGLDTVGSRRGGEARHRTLRATIAWSVDLLDPPTRRAFAGLSVFRGGWDLAAAERVADADGRTVEALLDKSLVHRLPGGARFGMLETVREYAAELAAPERAGLERRHTEHYLEALSAFGIHNPVRLPDAAHRWIADERENLRLVRERAAALGADAAAPPDDTVARVAALTWMDLSFTGAVAEAIALLEQALEQTSDPRVRCSLLDGLVLLLYRSDDPDRAQRYAAQEVATAREAQDPTALVDALRSCSTAGLTAAERSAGIDPVQQSLELALAAGDHWGAAAARVNLAVVAMNERRLAESLDLLRAALADLDEGTAWYGRTVILSNLAETLLALGRAEEAVEVVVGVYDDDAWAEQRVWVVDMASKLAIEAGLDYDGLVLAAAADDAFAALGQNREGLTDDEHRRLVDVAAVRVGEQETARARAEGRALGLDAALARGREVVRGLRPR